MKFIRDTMDKLEPMAKKNAFLHTVYDGIDTFLFQPKRVTNMGAHIRDGMDLKRTMIHVVLAMQLCYFAGTLNIGHQHYLSLGIYPGIFDGLGYKLLYGLFQLLPLFVVVHVVGLGIEFFFAAKKGHSIEEGFLVSGALIPLIMPPDISLWMLAVATAFSVIIVKEAFGGTGMNILNVALACRVFIFFAYPGEISGDSVWVSYDYNFMHKLFGVESHTLGLLGLSSIPDAGLQSLTIDGFTGATPLALAAQGGWDAVQGATLTIDGVAHQQYSVSNLLWGIVPGSIGEMNKVAIIIGAVILIATGIGSWRIMVSMIVGCAVTGMIMNALAVSVFPDSPFIAVPWYHQFLLGSFFFAMAFMATDPVTAAATDTGKLVFGFLIGAIGLIVRVLNPAYPEGWMLAILFLNVFAPLIDYTVLQANIKRRLKRAVQ